ncbi:MULTISPECIES: hypothetical protein [Rhodopseudomonas]|uniref:hypothetical protein n=1 Tax=Rhodopseudomonas TaxID=1073 RepID=UPI00069723D4|nr:MULTISPECIES: hypothetical protein [Rhodopseudomonas]MDF3812387.1 hypothetical protein [Rhodopseudomonas sp. BAL398]WOK20419.1 hypothetical protein RBJ75_13255 [Rhodopseudomonas sp. BAL398]
MKIAKILCVLVVAIVFASMTRTFLGWNESRGVHDDICYLRQAHLFQKFGLSGINTDIALETDGYLATKLREIGYPNPDDPLAPCHNLMPGTGRIVMQYPPGTGFALAIFPAGFQVAPLYAVATGLLFLMVLASIAYAATPMSLAVATVAGGVSMYLMNNPVKSSYSLPPTMVICALAGFLTVVLFVVISPKLRLASVASLGLLFGLSVDVRLANALLAAGYCGFFAIQFLAQRKWREFAEGAIFAVSFVIGLIPTLIANAVNAGSPFTTTYPARDASPPNFSIAQLTGQLVQYLHGTQGVLLTTAIVGVLAAAGFARPPMRAIGVLVGCNLLINLLFYLSHTIYTPYYAVPAAMLSLWTLLSGYLYTHRATALEAGRAARRSPLPAAA